MNEKEILLGALCDAVLSGDWDYESCRSTIQEYALKMKPDKLSETLTEFKESVDADAVLDSEILSKAVLNYVKRPMLNLAVQYQTELQKRAIDNKKEKTNSRRNIQIHSKDTIQQFDENNLFSNPKANTETKQPSKCGLFSGCSKIGRSRS